MAEMSVPLQNEKGVRAGWGQKSKSVIPDSIEISLAWPCRAAAGPLGEKSTPLVNSGLTYQNEAPMRTNNQKDERNKRQYR